MGYPKERVCSEELTRTRVSMGDFASCLLLHVPSIPIQASCFPLSLHCLQFSKENLDSRHHAFVHTIPSVKFSSPKCLTNLEPYWMSSKQQPSNFLLKPCLIPALRFLLTTYLCLPLPPFILWTSSPYWAIISFLNSRRSVQHRGAIPISWVTKCPNMCETMNQLQELLLSRSSRALFFPFYKKRFFYTTYFY